MTKLAIGELEEGFVTIAIWCELKGGEVQMGEAEGVFLLLKGGCRDPSPSNMETGR